MCKLGEISHESVEWWLPHRRDNGEPARLVRSHVALAHTKSTKSTDSMETVVLTVNLKLGCAIELCLKTVKLTVGTGCESEFNIGVIFKT